MCSSDLYPLKVQQRPLINILTQVYGKPVELNLRPTSKSFLDASVLTKHVAQILRDRKNGPVQSFKAAKKAPLPTRTSVPTLAEHSAVASRLLRRKPALRPVGAPRSKVSSVVREMMLKKVSSLHIEVRGRLGRRNNADRAAKKDIRRGLSAKAPGFMLRGVRPIQLQYSQINSKRRAGAFGVRAIVGHS